MPRLFVAVLPDEPTRERLRALGRPDESGVRWVPAANWHITLRFIGEADVDAVAALLHRLDGDVCTAVLGPALEMLGGRQLVVPASGLETLAARVRTVTAPIGTIDRRPFVGHLTVARTKRAVTPTMIGAPCSARFDVAEVALVASDLRPSGAVHTTVATFPLSESTSRRG